MAAQNMPVAEVDITPDLVRALLADQHPDLADLDLIEIANGWDNVIFRLGAAYSVRVPRREMAAQLILNEARWLQGWAERLPIPVPEPIRHGIPTADYPWHWNICPWFDGAVAADCTLDDPNREARRLGEFLAALHVPMERGGPVNPFRGQPLRELDARFRANVDRLGVELDRAAIDVAAIMARWQELAAVPAWDGPPVFLHGDVHTANILVHHGEIAAVIDFGDVTTGDPAVDFAVAWMMFDEHGRGEFRAAAGGLGDALWSRAEAWALHFALLYVLNSADNPLIAGMGERLLRVVMSGQAP